MMSSNWPAPAKINLFLLVTGKRDDGYHNIQSAMQLLDYGDSLDFQIRKDQRIRTSSNNAAIGNNNLCTHAASLLQATAGIHQGVDIKLHKRLPIGAGLGGGSSDAATCLIALNQLWQIGMDTDALANLGLCIGADVPFFVRGHSGIAEGTGEIITPMPLERQCFMVAWSKTGVATGKIYQHPDLPRNSEAREIQEWNPELNTIGNDFTGITCKLYPEIKELLDFMHGLEGPDTGEARMSGTGGSVFLPFAGQQQAEAALTSLPQQWDAFIAHSIDQSPATGGQKSSASKYHL